MLGISEFAVCVRHSRALEAVDSNSELDFTFSSAGLRDVCNKKCCASVCTGGERNISKTALLLEVSALAVHL